MRKKKTRIVFLSIPSESDLETEYPSPIWAFGENQLKWLEDIALDTLYDVILVSHVPFYYFRNDTKEMLPTWNGTKATMSYIVDLSGRIEDCDDAVAILRDFNDRTNGKLIACLSGHTHVDSIWEPYEKREEHRNPLPCYQIVTRGACIPENEHLQYGISVDIIVWTPSQKKLNFVRIGDGEDREIGGENGTTDSK